MNESLIKTELSEVGIPYILDHPNNIYKVFTSGNVHLGIPKELNWVYGTAYKFTQEIMDCMLAASIRFQLDPVSSINDSFHLHVEDAEKLQAMLNSDHAYSIIIY